MFILLYVFCFRARKLLYFLAAKNRRQPNYYVLFLFQLVCELRRCR